MKLCDYGCGQEATHQFKNGKWCCNIYNSSCPEIRKKKVGGKRSKEFKEKDRSIINTFIVLKDNNSILCQFGCNSLAKYIIYGNKYCCNKYHIRCEHQKESNGFGKNSIERYGEEKSKELKENHSKRMKELWKDPNSKYHKEFKEKRRKYMLNGGSSHANSFIKNPSKPQVELYNRIKEIYPSAELNFPYLNYSLDIAIPNLKIWIESDGPYWHQDKEYDLKRQKKIENLGWKCIRYIADTINDVPSQEKIKNDILAKK